MTMCTVMQWFPLVLLEILLVFRNKKGLCVVYCVRPIPQGTSYQALMKISCFDASFIDHALVRSFYTVFISISSLSHSTFFPSIFLPFCHFLLCFNLFPFCFLFFLIPSQNLHTTGSRKFTHPIDSNTWLVHQACPFH